MNNLTYILTSVFIMAAVTYMPRVFPVLALKNKLKSRFLRSFLYYVPFAVLGAMIFPQILFSTGHIYSAAAGMAAALVLAYLERGLMTVAVGAISAVFLSELFM